MCGRSGAHPTELLQQQYELDHKKELDRKKGVRFSDKINDTDDTDGKVHKAAKAVTDDKIRRYARSLLADKEHKPPAAPVNPQVPVINPSQQAPGVSANNSTEPHCHSRQPDSQETFPSRGSRQVVRGDSPGRVKRESAGVSPVNQHLLAAYLSFDLLRCSQLSLAIYAGIIF